MKTHKQRITAMSVFVVAAIMGFAYKYSQPKPQPRIVNIINFIRQTEPREEAITDEVLYQTVASQVAELKKYNFKGTFLLQYDALINPKYAKLLTEETVPGTEIGAWWEITQPHVEDAGLEWRGRFPWDWHADVGFSSGYTPEEREKLVDVYMAKFKEVFGTYPKSVGSWFIDAHTLGYLYDKYHITASCNCKDQMGTDGYTLWGGYWNQAYYPSRVNAYMPAQTTEGMIPVPIFRMLGSDPIYQYDTGLGTTWQGVLTLEPVWGKGKDPKWVDWFFRHLATGPCLNFAYTQAGQENSFIWSAVEEGYTMQMAKLNEYAKRGELQIQTLAESGQWFKDNFEVTPPTAMAALDDHSEGNRKTVWFNSRFYRANLLWVDSTMYFRDIHLFDQNFKSRYYDRPCTSNQCIFTTLPIVDGFAWSRTELMAGLRFVQTDENSEVKEMPLGLPYLEEDGDEMCITFSASPLKIRLTEITIEATLPEDMNWQLQFTACEGATLPFKTLTPHILSAEHDGFAYQLKTEKGTFDGDTTFPFTWRIHSEHGKVVLNCKNK